MDFFSFMEDDHEDQPSNIGPIRSNSRSRAQRLINSKQEIGAPSQIDLSPLPSLPPQPPLQNKHLKRGGRRASKSVDPAAKLERSRQSARECRARKKLRYQYLEDLVKSREQAVLALKNELEQVRQWAHEIDEGKIPEGVLKLLEEEKAKRNRQQTQTNPIGVDC